MANINDAYPSRYLSVEDLQGRTVSVVIDRVSKQTIGQGQNSEQKLVATLVGKKKEFVINKTNAKAIAKSHGDDYDNWEGKSISLAPREVEFSGETVWAIRVITPMPGAPIGKPVESLPARAAAPAKQPEALEGDPF